MTTLPATQVRQNLFSLLGKLNRTLAPLTITLGGKPKAVLMPVDEFESWIETMEILSDKRLMKDIKKAQQEVAHGKWITLKELKKKNA